MVSARLTVVDSPAAFAALAALIRDYVASLGFPLTFQDVERELSDLPSQYGPPSGRAFLVRVDTRIAGGIAVRRFDDGSAELKRMYVRPEFRGLGLGRRLAEAAVEAAAELGYRRILLDTLASMETAVAIYRTLGFQTIGAYRDNPLAGAIFMERSLQPLPNSEG